MCIRDREYTDKELPYETLVNKVRGLRYVAYNVYDRDDAMPHFYYVQGLEYLLKRALEEEKQIPADLVATPEYGKKVYDMRHPCLLYTSHKRNRLNLSGGLTGTIEASDDIFVFPLPDAEIESGNRNER